MNRILPLICLTTVSLHASQTETSGSGSQMFSHRETSAHAPSDPGTANHTATHTEESFCIPCFALGCTYINKFTPLQEHIHNKHRGQSDQLLEQAYMFIAQYHNQFWAHFYSKLMPQEPPHKKQRRSFQPTPLPPLPIPHHLPGLHELAQFPTVPETTMVASNGPIPIQNLPIPLPMQPSPYSSDYQDNNSEKHHGTTVTLRQRRHRTSPRSLSQESDAFYQENLSEQGASPSPPLSQEKSPQFIPLHMINPFLENLGFNLSAPPPNHTSHNPILRTHLTQAPRTRHRAASQKNMM